MTGTDEDGRPCWASEPGDLLVPGHQAWAPLGVGHRTEAWLAWSVPLQSPAVVKLARPDRLDDPRARDSLRREAVGLAGLTHPGFPRLYADGHATGVPHVVAEYVDGPSLDEDVEDEGLLDAASTVRLGVQLLSALHALHARGIAHLDVKPENIVLRDRRPVLVDLGSARRFGEHQEGGCVGTVGWAAPELERPGPVGPAADVYGVGAVLADVGDGALDLGALLDPDPATRATVAVALAVLRGLAPAGDPPLPAWAHTA